MATSTKRVRCLVCNQLVDSRVSASKPYAVEFITVDKKRGCICSYCIDDLYSKYTDEFEKVSGLSRKSNFENIIPFPSPILSVNHDPLSSLFSSFSASHPLPVQVSYAPKKNNEQKPTSSVKEKFTSLDYSLDSYFSIVKNKVFGQDDAAKMLLYTIYYNQMANLIEHLSGDDLGKRNHILLIGNTGVGKTFLATTVAETMHIPYALSNATSITSAGYIGDKVENLLERLYRNAGCNLELAENGIIILDEIDKKKVSPDGSSRDVTGRSVQQELLKILEPSTVYLKEYDISFNTKNITLILLGAFVGLDEIIDKRLNKKVIGFRSSENAFHDRTVTVDDIINYGFIPEFVGRIPAIITLNDLTKSNIIDIIYALLLKINNFFKIKEIDLIVDDYFIDRLAEDIVSSCTAARDVYKRCFHIFYPALYRVFQSNAGGVCTIDSDGNIELLVNDKTKVPRVYNFESSTHLSSDDEDSSL